MEGWIKLHRKLAENPFWTCEPFTRGQAWVDLLLLANHEDNFFYVRGIKVNLKRGEVGWSEPKLAERWKWSRTKLRNFLNDLEKEQQIIQQKNNITQVITIINFDEYQKKEQQPEQQKDSRRTAEEQQKDVDKNDKNDKNNIGGKKNLPPAINERKKIFYDKVAVFITNYDKQTLRDFYDYWTESNGDGKKMRFEMEKVFDISRRLTTWEKNNSKFNSKSLASAPAENKTNLKAYKPLKV